MGHNFADRSLDHPHRQAELLVLAGRALGMSQEKLGELLGVSRRTMTRWTSRGTTLARDDATTLARARRLGLDPAAALDLHDTEPFFERLGDLLVTGPTGTNVCDWVFAIRR